MEAALFSWKELCPVRIPKHNDGGAPNCSFGPGLLSHGLTYLGDIHQDALVEEGVSGDMCLQRWHLCRGYRLRSSGNDEKESISL